MELKKNICNGNWLKISVIGEKYLQRIVNLVQGLEHVGGRVLEHGEAGEELLVLPHVGPHPGALLPGQARVEGLQPQEGDGLGQTCRRCLTMF